MDQKTYVKLSDILNEAFEYYSNVHRGSGENSQKTTLAYENCRHDILDYFGLDTKRYSVIFCSPAASKRLISNLKKGSYRVVTSQEKGLPLGVVAIAAETRQLPEGIPVHTGGGTARLVSPGWVIWEKAPDRFEAGTPAVLNIITFVSYLKLSRKESDSTESADDQELKQNESILNPGEFSNMPGEDILSLIEKEIGGRKRTELSLPGRFINLDYAASTPAFRQSFSTFLKVIRASEDECKNVVEETRSIISKFFGAPAGKYEVIFTRNTTEAINIAAANEACQTLPDKGLTVINSILEHNSNELPWRNAQGANVIRIGLGQKGSIDAEELEKCLSRYSDNGNAGRNRNIIVALTGASNVLCVYNELDKIGALTRKYGAKLLVDAAQMAAHRKIDMEGSGIDYLAFSGHKAYAPFGSGALIVRKGLLKLDDETIALYKSSGEENAAGIAALGKALSILKSIGLDLIASKEKDLTKRCISGLSAIKGVTPYGLSDATDPLFERKGPVVAFEVKDKWPQKISKVLAEKGFGVRYGCHCAHMLVKKLVGVPPFLEQFQGILLRLFPKLSLPGIMRISFGIGTTESDIDLFIREIEKISMDKQ